VGGEKAEARPGPAVGALVPAFDGFIRFGDAARPMTKTDLVSMLVAVTTLAIACVTGFLWKRKPAAKKGAVETIRGRPKVPVARN
jgi:hypothetical protein